MGVNLNLHYCHGEVDSISFFVEDGSCICDEAFPDRADKMTCCFDENFKAELDADQITTSILKFDFKIDIDFIQSITSIFETFNSSIHFTERLNKPPPDFLFKSSLNILFSVFIL